MDVADRVRSRSRSVPEEEEPRKGSSSSAGTSPELRTQERCWSNDSTSIFQWNAVNSWLNYRNSNRIPLAESCTYQFCCRACAAGLMTEKEVLAPSSHFIPPTAHRSQMLTVLKYTLYVRNCQKLSEYIVRQYVAQVWTQDTRHVFLRMCESYVVRPDKGHDGKREGQREATARIRSGHVREMVSLVSQSHFGNLDLSKPILGLPLAYPWPFLFGLFRRPPGQTANPERNAGEWVRDAGCIRRVSPVAPVAPVFWRCQEWNSTKAENEEFWKAPRFALCSLALNQLSGDFRWFQNETSKQTLKAEFKNIQNAIY